MNQRALPIFACLVLFSQPIKATEELDAADMIDIPLEALMQMDAVVNTASKQEAKLSETAAAAFVINAEDIRRAGVTSIPDALRMAPGIQVGRIDANSWGVSSRGLGGLFSRYLLVLIDGRSIYTSLFSGVNWNEQNLMLENIERIEVIRGPGGSVWGANAVNGVINIITKDAADTQDISLFAAAGNEVDKQYFAARTGGRLGPGYFRFSAHHKENGSLQAQDSNLEDREWDAQRISFNFDLTNDKHNVQFDSAYAEITTYSLWPVVSPIAPLKVIENPEEKRKHFFVQASHQHSLNRQHQYSSRASFDQTTRESSLYEWNTQNMDIDIEYSASPFSRYTFQAGFNTRFTESEYINQSRFSVELTPQKRNTERYSIFVQNQIDVTPYIQTILAARVDDHSLSGSAFQPSLRFLYHPSTQHRVWGAISKAESTPSRMVSDRSKTKVDAIEGTASTQYLNTLVSIVNNSGESSEHTTLTAYELGYRFFKSKIFEFDLALFHHEYDKLLMFNPDINAQLNFEGNTPFIDTQLSFEGTGDLNSSGAEVTINWTPHSEIQTQYSGSYFTSNSNLGQIGDDSFSIVSNSPKWQHSFRTSWELDPILTVSAWFKYIDEYENTPVKSYTDADLAFEFHFAKNLRMTILGKNLLDKNRVEYTREVFTVGNFEVPNYWVIKAEWTLSE